MKKTDKNKIKGGNPLEIQKELYTCIQKLGINIVTCGNCGATLLANKGMRDKDIITCVSCQTEMPYSCCPDLYY